MVDEKISAVSVIIPMYNAEKFIGECLESLLNQTLKNFEVIVIDDSSTDNSFSIAENFISAFESKNQLLLVAKISPNSGCPGLPRNVAINFAKGKYIYFLDSDDFLDATALEDFYKVAEEFNADVVHAEKCFEYREIDGEFVNKPLILESDAISEKPTLETFDIAKRITDFVEKQYNSMVWSKFFRREFLIENNITFPIITVSEDFIFSAMCLSCAKNYVRVPSVGYHYRKHGNSGTATPGTVKEFSLNLIEGVDFFYKFMQRQKFFVDNPKYQYAVLDVFSQMSANLIFKHTFFNMNLEPDELYDFYCKNIFALNPQKNIPLTAYLFVSTNIYKLLVKRQAAEIAALKKILQKENFE